MALSATVGKFFTNRAARLATKRAYRATNTPTAARAAKRARMLRQELRVSGRIDSIRGQKILKGIQARRLARNKKVTATGEGALRPLLPVGKGSKRPTLTVSGIRGRTFNVRNADMIRANEAAYRRSKNRRRLAVGAAIGAGGAAGYRYSQSRKRRRLTQVAA